MSFERLSSEERQTILELFGQGWQDATWLGRDPPVSLRGRGLLHSHSSNYCLSKGGENAAEWLLAFEDSVALEERREALRVRARELQGTGGALVASVQRALCAYNREIKKRNRAAEQGPVEAALSKAYRYLLTRDDAGTLDAEGQALIGDIESMVSANVLTRKLDS